MRRGSCPPSRRLYQPLCCLWPASWSLSRQTSWSPCRTPPSLWRIPCSGRGWPCQGSLQAQPPPWLASAPQGSPPPPACWWQLMAAASSPSLLHNAGWAPIGMGCAVCPIPACASPSAIPLSGWSTTSACASQATTPSRAPSALPAPQAPIALAGSSTPVLQEGGSPRSPHRAPPLTTASAAQWATIMQGPPSPAAPVLPTPGARTAICSSSALGVLAPPPQQAASFR